MDALDCINSRRTIREFSPRAIKESDLLTVLKSVTDAPCAGNLRTIRLVVVKDPEIKKEMSSASVNQTWMNDAPCLIVVCSIPDSIQREYKERGSNRYDYQAAGAAIQNMLLAANSLGLATAWVGAFSDSKIKHVLKIPDNVRVHAIVPLGLAMRYPKNPPTRPELADITYFGEWSEEYQAPTIFPIGDKIKEVNLEKLKKVAKKMIKK